MPLFEYKCKQCGHRFETLVLGGARRQPVCPACEGQEVEKQYSAFGFGSSGGRRSGAPTPSFSGG